MVLACVKPQPFSFVPKQRYAAGYDAAGLHGVSPNPPVSAVDVVKTFGSQTASLLDVGCGAGQKTLDASVAFCNTVGMDPSVELLDRAQARVLERKVHNVRFIEGRGEALPFATGSFDVVMCLMSGLYPDEIYRVLKPGGVAILEKLGTRDKKNIKIAFGKDAHGLRGQYLEMDEMAMRADLRRDFGKLFSHVTIEERSWKTYYSWQGLLDLLTHTPTVRDFDAERDRTLFENLVLEASRPPLGIETTQRRLIITARKAESTRRA